MSDEQYALSPAVPPPPTEADYEAIFAAVMETVRGRWFLSEFGRRNRQADTQLVLAAIDRLESTMRGERADPSFERIRTDIREMAAAIAATKREIAAIRVDADHTNLGEATEQLDSIVHTTERATSDILAAAESIQETAWTLREQGIDGSASDQLDSCATDIYLACSFQDLTGQRIRKVIQVLRYLEGRVNAMVEILGGDAERPADGPAPVHAPLDTDMDQSEIDAVIPTTHAGASEWRVADPDPATLLDPDDGSLSIAVPAAERTSPAATGDTLLDLERAVSLAVAPEPDLVEVSELDQAEHRPMAGLASGKGLGSGDINTEIVAFEDIGPASAEVVSGEPEERERTAQAADMSLATVDHATDQTAPELGSGDADAAPSQSETPPETAETAAMPDFATAAAAPDKLDRPDDLAADTEEDGAARPLDGPGIAPDTKALMADLLAIIRPVGAAARPADEPDAAAVAEGFAPGAEAPSLDPAPSAPAEPPAHIGDLLASEFVIVPLAEQAANHDLAEAAGELGQTPSEAGTISPPDSALSAEDIVAGTVETVHAEEDGEPAAAVETSAMLGNPSAPATAAEHGDWRPLPTSTDVDDVVETDRDVAAGTTDRVRLAVDEEAASQSELAGLDDDVLVTAELSPMTRIFATETATQADDDVLAPPAMSDHGNARFEPSLPRNVGEEAAPADNVEATAPAPHFASDDISHADSAEAGIAAAEAAEILTPDQSEPVREDSERHEEAVPVAPAETAATDVFSTAPALAVTPVAPEAAMPPEPAAVAAAVDGPPQWPLAAGATVALAVMAMTPASESDPIGESAHDVALGHADPLAVVKALSAEERIALFS